MNLKPECMIFSLNNADYLNELKREGIPFKNVLGCYKNQQESSYVVNVQEDDNYNMVISICRRDGQESVLHLDQARMGTLIYIKPWIPSVKLGQFRPITATEASQLDAWSFDHSTLQYWGI